MATARSRSSRTIQWNQNGSDRPFYDPAGTPIMDRGISSTYRVYGPGVDEPLAEKQTTSPPAYFLRDGLGSITTVTNDQGVVLYTNRYTAFGKRTTSALPSGVLASRLSYTSRENSLGGLYQYRSRYYDSGVGRFLSQDTYRGTDTAPPSLQRYVYTLNDPVRYTDPSGNIVQLIAWIFLIEAFHLFYELFEFLGSQWINPESD